MNVEQDTQVPYGRPRHQKTGSTSDSEPIQKKQRQSDVSRARDEQQQESAAAGSHSTGRQHKTTFKALGNLVLAMKRFQASLNPTYTYGRQGSPAPCTVSATQSSCASQEDSGVQYSYPDRGHKAALLMQPLPDIPHPEDHEEIKSCQRKTKSE